MEDLFRMFTAVRAERWKAGEVFVAGFEQGLEIREGTARYVEMKALSLLKNTTRLPGFARFSFPGRLKEDFQARFAGETVSPEDMPRNRIYPVGAGLGYLCDFLGLEWKLSAQAAGPEFAFHLLFSQKLGAAETSAEGLATRAKEIYGYEDILKATDRQIGEYREGFSREFESFNRQPQEKLEFEFSYRGISRSRNSLDKPRFLSELRTGSNGRPRATSPSPSPDVHMKRSREAGDRQNRSLFSPFSRVWIN